MFFVFNIIMWTLYLSGFKTAYCVFFNNATLSMHIYWEIFLKYKKLIFIFFDISGKMTDLMFSRNPYTKQICISLLPVVSSIETKNPLSLFFYFHLFCVKIAIPSFWCEASFKLPHNVQMSWKRASTLMPSKDKKSTPQRKPGVGLKDRVSVGFVAKIRATRARKEFLISSVGDL